MSRRRLWNDKTWFEGGSNSRSRKTWPRIPSLRGRLKEQQLCKFSTATEDSIDEMPSRKMVACGLCYLRRTLLHVIPLPSVWALVGYLRRFRSIRLLPVRLHPPQQWNIHFSWHGAFVKCHELRVFSDAWKLHLYELRFGPWFVWIMKSK